MATPVLKIDSNQKNKLDASFAAAFGGTPDRYFSAPGRTEIGGNHTDHQRGCAVRGFDAYCESTVLPGSGLSSSAAFEVLIGTIFNHLFFDTSASQAEIARIGQYAENVFFGKPCGLMDQTASAVGNLVTIDFFDKDHPVIRPVNFDFVSCGHALCIIDTGASHADLTEEYAAIPNEINLSAHISGKRC